MGYDLHITRRADWIDEGDDIPLAEWIALVDAEPEMRLERDGPGAGQQGFAIWTGHSRHDGRDENIAWLAWRDGNVDAKNPDQELRRQMWRLAERLKARVQGDDGEFYDAAGNGAYSAAEAEPGRPWWKFW